MSMEMIVRRLVQIEIAVTRSASSPDYIGLDVLLEAPISDSGAASTRALDDRVTSRLKERAQIAKQTRLYREENSHGSKGKGAGGGANDASEGWKKKRRAKAKASAGAEGSGAADH